MYPPSSILKAAGLDVGAVCRACGLDRPDLVPVRPAPRWMTRWWQGPVAAMTLPWGIYVSPEVLGGDRRVLARLLVHELVHVRQWRALGIMAFTSHYLQEYLRGRRRGLRHFDAYLAVDLEREAREIAGG